MPNTDGRWVAEKGFTDGQLFIGVNKFIDIAGLATGPTNPSLGLYEKSVPSTDAATFVIALEELFQRSGVYATPAYDQEQFGTASQLGTTLVQPGPSLVSGTGGPLQLPQGQPPMTSSKLATVSGNYVAGPPIKGVQIDSFDVIYQVNTVAATLATVGLTRTVFANGVAPVATAIVAIAANGLPTATATHPQVTNVAVTTPVYIAGNDSEYLINLNLTAGTGGTITVFGIVVKFHFNFA